MSLKDVTYCDGPPCIFVLWCISFQTTVSEFPEVADVPTVNINLASNALLNFCSTSLPSGVFGKKAQRVVPVNFLPGLGCSSFWMPSGMEYVIFMVEQCLYPGNSIWLKIWSSIVPFGWFPVIFRKGVLHSGQYGLYFNALSMQLLQKPWLQVVVIFSL